MCGCWLTLLKRIEIIGLHLKATETNCEVDFVARTRTMVENDVWYYSRHSANNSEETLKSPANPSIEEKAFSVPSPVLMEHAVTFPQASIPSVSKIQFFSRHHERRGSISSHG